MSRKFKRIKEIIIEESLQDVYSIETENTQHYLTTGGLLTHNCFPKDLVAMIGKAKELNVDVSLLEKVWTENLRIRKIRDWENIKWAITTDSNKDCHKRNCNFDKEIKE